MYAIWNIATHAPIGFFTDESAATTYADMLDISGDVEYRLDDENTMRELSHAELLQIRNNINGPNPRNKRADSKGKAVEEIMQLGLEHVGEPEAPKKAKKQKAKKQKIVEVLKNGLRPTKSLVDPRWPVKDGPCLATWLQCQLVHADNPEAKRAEYIAACVTEGINPATASTQYQCWRVWTAKNA